MQCIHLMRGFCTNYRKITVKCSMKDGSVSTLHFKLCSVIWQLMPTTFIFDANGPTVLQVFRVVFPFHKPFCRLRTQTSQMLADCSTLAVSFTPLFKQRIRSPAVHLCADNSKFAVAWFSEKSRNYTGTPYDKFVNGGSRGMTAAGTVIWWYL